MAFTVVVDTGKCVGCGKCVMSCPQKVYDMAGRQSSPARPNDCVGCQTCVKNCPVQAITVSGSPS